MPRARASFIPASVIPSALSLVGWLLVCLLPSLFWLWFVWRTPPQRDPLLAVGLTFGLGFGLALPVGLAQNALASFIGLSELPRSLGSPELALFVLLFAAPLQEACKLAATWPAFRSSHFDEDFDGLLYATAASTGFASCQGALTLSLGHRDAAAVLGTLILVVAQPLLASLWGHALGRVRRTRVPSLRFSLAWLGATLVHGLLEHLAEFRSVLSLTAAVSLLAGLAAVTWWAARDLMARYGRSSRPSLRSILPPLPQPSIAAMRQVLHPGQQPILFRWIGLGTLTTTGVMLSLLSVAIWLGHRLHLDFSAIERTEEMASSMGPPLVLLTGSLLLAFPLSGYLIAKASGSGGVLEPALSAGLAIGAVLVLLGMAAPTALVFALAFAPIAFLLACAGAWVGLGR